MPHTKAGKIFKMKKILKKKLAHHCDLLESIRKCFAAMKRANDIHFKCRNWIELNCGNMKRNIIINSCLPAWLWKLILEWVWVFVIFGWRNLTLNEDIDENSLSFSFFLIRWIFFSSSKDAPLQCKYYSRDVFTLIHYTIISIWLLDEARFHICY